MKPLLKFAFLSICFISACKQTNKEKPSTFLFSDTNQTIENIEDIFSYGDIMNQTYEDSANLEKYKASLDTLNINLIQSYLDAISTFQFQKAEKLISNNKKLSKTPERAIAIMYTLFFVQKNNLLGNPCIQSSSSSSFDFGKIVYFSAKDHSQLIKMKKDSLKLKAKLIKTLPLVKQKIYSLECLLN